MSTEVAPGYIIHEFDLKLQEALANGEVAPGVQEITHYQTDDLYGRRCRIPSGTVGATLVHKYDHIAICLSGTVVLVDQNGEKQTITAPAVVITKKGTQRAVLAVTDVDWVTVHHCENQDLDNIESILGCKTMAEYQNLLTHTEH
jgi:quercetin dioxygenase-like cupin family protein